MCHVNRFLIDPLTADHPAGVYQVVSSSSSRFISPRHPTRTLLSSTREKIACEQRVLKVRNIRSEREREKNWGRRTTSTEKFNFLTHVTKSGRSTTRTQWFCEVHESFLLSLVALKIKHRKVFIILNKGAWRGVKSYRKLNKED